ncbi:hypothetical protein BDV96DRAFT_576539 [Lophiotrema nucula]|uniref:25S rRNA adenine-N(1) methyltransferase n=1 Tax=Lophiotrema nucula TaxID=690887 RepID=A0A6A5Z6M9_9PLEO|nr:hypothetical protein BDV96DRAFT_576539 [Lophiotrema nucula]
MASKKRPKPLSHGRPPIQKEKERMSSKLSATIIRSHHRLNKDLAAAVKRGDQDTIQRLEKAIKENGGLKQYQAASKQGQSASRGGDSSKILVQWLQDADILPTTTATSNPNPNHPPPNTTTKPLKLLEIGALSTKNAISQFPTRVEVTRIDLHSQGPGILQQDFMQRPLPSSSDEKFDVVSLSLVLNYVPDPVQRGEMLRRIPLFLRQQSACELGKEKLPALFLVLPLPCIQNSRYLSEDLLLAIMRTLGFEVTQRKLSNKLCYYLFQLVGTGSGEGVKKRVVRDGPGMNNFCVVVE